MQNTIKSSSRFKNINYTRNSINRKIVHLRHFYYAKIEKYQLIRQKKLHNLIAEIYFDYECEKCDYKNSKHEKNKVKKTLDQISEDDSSLFGSSESKYTTDIEQDSLDGLNENEDSVLNVILNKNNHNNSNLNDENLSKLEKETQTQIDQSEMILIVDFLNKNLFEFEKFVFKRENCDKGDGTWVDKSHKSINKKQSLIEKIKSYSHILDYASNHKDLIEKNDHINENIFNFLLNFYLNNSFKHKDVTIESKMSHTKIIAKKKSSIVQNFANFKYHQPVSKPKFISPFLNNNNNNGVSEYKNDLLIEELKHALEKRNKAREASGSVAVNTLH
jgi:hypothetical protein